MTAYLVPRCEVQEAARVHRVGVPCKPEQVLHGVVLPVVADALIVKVQRQALVEGNVTLVHRVAVKVEAAGLADDDGKEVGVGAIEEARFGEVAPAISRPVGQAGPSEATR